MCVCVCVSANTRKLEPNWRFLHAFERIIKTLPSFLICFCYELSETSLHNSLYQGCSECGPRAICGPYTEFLQQAAVQEWQNLSPYITGVWCRWRFSFLFVVRVKFSPTILSIFLFITRLLLTSQNQLLSDLLSFAKYSWGFERKPPKSCSYNDNKFVQLRRKELETRSFHF